MKRALVLSGGGNKGAFEIGALYHLITKQYYEFELFSGTSVGAMNAGFLAQGVNWEEQAALIEILKNKWLSIDNSRQIYHFKMLNIFKMVFGGALFQPVGLKRLINSLITPEKLANGKPLLIPSVSLEDGQLFVADSRRKEDRLDMQNFLLASASMPVYFPPVEIRGKHWVDGGLREYTPLNLVLNEYPNEVVVIITYPVTKDLEPVFPKFSKMNHIFAVLHRMLDIVTAENTSNDLQVARSIAQRNQSFRKSDIRLIVIAPQNPFEKYSLDFSKQILHNYYKIGEEAAQNILIYN